MMKSRDEAQAILTERLAQYRTYPYERLAALVGSCETAEVMGAGGAPYQLEFEFFWDDQAAGDVRVVGAIDGGGISAFRPLSDDFIKAPDGKFVGE